MINKITGSIIQKWEPLLFLCFTLLTVYPVVTAYFFTTVDGPSHAYNANLLYNLLFHSKSGIQEFIAVNPAPVANWLGHMLTAIFRLFLNTADADKLLNILYIFAFAYSFRFLILSASGSLNFSYAVFPLIVSNTFYYGL